MSNVAVSRRPHTNKKENKENALPGRGGKSLIKREVSKLPMATAPFQLKSNEMEETLVNSGPLKATAKQVGTKSTSAVPSSKSAPGMYKGKIIQSKIGSIWKSSATIDQAEPRSLVTKTERQGVGNLTKGRSKSVVDVSRRGSQKPAPPRSKSVLDRHMPISKPSVSSRPATGSRSAHLPAKSVPASLSTSSRNTTAAPTKRSGIQSSKPKIPVTDKKVNKPLVAGTLNKYRSTETLEEKRAKLAEWLASKGKTLKRPPMTTAAPPKSKTSAKPKVDVKSQSNSHDEAQHEQEARVEALRLESVAPLCVDTQRTAAMTQSETPVVKNTSLALLEDSDVDLSVDLQDGVDDIVVNLCDALNAMETPSRCMDELSQGTDECSGVVKEGGNLEDGCSEEEEVMKNNISEQSLTQQVKDEEKVETDDVVEELESDDEDYMETPPQMEDASVVKYSVKTTPYLQSVKKTIDHDASASSSRRKSNIKDLKFLTPVRRSSRIQRQSSRLPSMLVDHDPCVSSLAELVNLDDDLNAYIYRKNPALLEKLPDQPRL